MAMQNDAWATAMIWQQIRRYFVGRSLFEILIVTIKTVVGAIQGLRPIERRARWQPGAFDRQWGTETTNVVKRRDLDFPPDEAANFNQYEVSAPDILQKLLNIINLDPTEFTFVDVGAGKGRIVLEASFVPFYRCIGVEYSEDLYDIALTNTRLFVERAKPSVRPEFWHGDARDFRLPPGPLLLYLYNPFSLKILDEFISRIENEISSQTRKIFLAYVNPEHLRIFGGRSHWQKVSEAPEITVFQLRA